MLGFLQLLLRALHRVFDGRFVDLLFGDGVLRQYANGVTVDLGEPAANREPLRTPPLVMRNSPFSICVSNGIWPGRMPISPSTVGITTESMVSEYTFASGVTISSMRGMFEKD